MTLEKIKKIYQTEDICMGELLASISAKGLDLENAFLIYIEAMKWAEGDRFFRQPSDDPLEKL